MYQYGKQIEIGLNSLELKGGRSSQTGNEQEKPIHKSCLSGENRKQHKEQDQHVNGCARGYKGKFRNACS